jgi:hypothetical protein
MVVTVTCGAASAVTLDEPADFTRFHVAVRGGRDRSSLASALSDADAGHLDGDDAVILVPWLRTAAAGRVGADWEDGLAGMLAYAERKGWTDNTHGWVRAHVEDQ